MDKLHNRKGGNIMEKYLGLEYEDLAEREQYIKDNADSIENMGYSKPIPSDQIEKLKETLADASIKKLEQEEAKKAAVQMYNEEIKGYKLIDQQTRQVGYYTKEGTLVYQRAARHDELQPNIFKLNPAKTGTDDK